MDIVVRVYHPGFTFGGRGDLVQARDCFGTYSSNEPEPEANHGTRLGLSFSH